jgi:hypothetical protein
MHPQVIEGLSDSHRSDLTAVEQSVISYYGLVGRETRGCSAVRCNVMQRFEGHPVENHRAGVVLVGWAIGAASAALPASGLP